MNKLASYLWWLKQTLRNFVLFLKHVFHAFLYAGLKMFEMAKQDNKVTLIL